MRTLIILVIMLAFIYACGITKKDVFSNKQQSTATQELAASQAYNHSFTESLIIDDSLNSNAVFTIWPKGVFTYSPDAGFKGEAEKLQVLTQSWQLKQSEQKIAQVNAGTKTLAEKNVAIVKSKVSEDHTLKWQPNYWIILMVVGVIILGYWLFRRLKKFI